MKLLMNLINELFSQHSCWKFHIIQESSWEWVDLQICYDDVQKRIQTSVNWKKDELANLYWESGLISSESENAIEEWIRKKGHLHKVKGIAPDTNLIIPGFITTFLKRIIGSPHDIVPVLVLFARSIQYELHTMRVFSYSRISSVIEDFFQESIKKWPSLIKLWNFSEFKPLESQIKRLHNERGRLGMKGTYEVDELHRWAPVIIIKPSHVLHSPRVLEESPFLNAVHDSLIRYEVDFIHQNTSLPILFLSNDKDQCKAATQEGIETLHVKKPKYNSAIETNIHQNIDLERIRLLILSLLTNSPVVRITSQKGDYFLSWTWKGRSMDDITNHKIRVIDDQKNIRIIDP